MKRSYSWPRKVAGGAALAVMTAAPLVAAPPKKTPARGVAGRPAAAAPGPPVQKRREGLVEVMPVTPRAAQEAARLGALAKQGAWDDWLRLYQKMVEDETLLLPRGERLLVSLRTYCHDEFAKLPPAVRQRYRTLYDQEAGAALKAASEKGPEHVAEVYGRYRNTAAGRAALRWLADRALDYGEWEMARCGYRRLTATPETTQAELLRYSLAAERAGAADEAARALARAKQEFGAAAVKVGGRRVDGVAAVALFQKASAAGDAALPPQPATPLGGPAGSAALPKGPLEALWTVRFPPRPSPQVQDYYYYRYQNASRGDFNFLSYPAAVGDRLYVQGPRQIVALDGASGKPVWERKGFFLPDDEDLPRYVSRRRRDDGPYVYSGGRPFQGMPE